MNPNPKLSLEEHIRLLGLIVEGKTQGQIALSFGLSREAIKKRAQRMRAFFGAESTAQAVAIAISKGLLSMGDKEAVKTK